MTLGGTVGLALAALAVVGLTACTETTVTRIDHLPWETTSTVDPAIANDPQVAADRRLVVDLYGGQSEAWDDGITSGIDFMVRWNHPSEGPEDACREYFEEGMGFFPEGYWESYEVLEETFGPAPGWELPRSGSVPEGRLYEYSVRVFYQLPGEPVQRDMVTVHAAILDGEAYFFIRCEF